MVPTRNVGSLNDGAVNFLSCCDSKRTALAEKFKKMLQNFTTQVLAEKLITLLAEALEIETGSAV